MNKETKDLISLLRNRPLSNSPNSFTISMNQENRMSIVIKELNKFIKNTGIEDMDTFKTFRYCGFEYFLVRHRKDRLELSLALLQSPTMGRTSSALPPCFLETFCKPLKSQ